MANPSFYMNPTYFFFLSETVEESGFLITRDSNSLIQAETHVLKESSQLLKISGNFYQNTWSGQQFWNSFLHLSHDEDICYQDDNTLSISFPLPLALPTASWAIFPVTTCSLLKQLDRWNKNKFPCSYLQSHHCSYWVSHWQLHR